MPVYGKIWTLKESNPSLIFFHWNLRAIWYTLASFKNVLGILLFNSRKMFMSYFSLSKAFLFYSCHGILSPYIAFFMLKGCDWLLYYSETEKYIKNEIWYLVISNECLRILRISPPAQFELFSSLIVTWSIKSISKYFWEVFSIWRVKLYLNLMKGTGLFPPS